MRLAEMMKENEMRKESEVRMKAKNEELENENEKLRKHNGNKLTTY